jgi:hypothetical protein
LEEEKAAAAPAQALQVVREVVVLVTQELMREALVTLHQPTPPKETTVALVKAMVQVRNLVAAVVVVLEQLDQTHLAHHRVALEVQERLVQLLDQVLLAPVVAVVAPML